MYYPDPMLEKQDYEARVNWLQSLYDGHKQPYQPSRVSHLTNHLLFVLGSYLVSLGERMQGHHNVPTSSPMMK